MIRGSYSQEAISSFTKTLSRVNLFTLSSVCVKYGCPSGSRERWILFPFDSPTLNHSELTSGMFHIASMS